MLCFSRASNIVFKKYYCINSSITPNIIRYRFSSESKISDTKKIQKKLINFFDDQLKHNTKVPQVPYKNEEALCGSDDAIDKDTFLLLERLSLVNVEDK